MKRQDRSVVSNQLTPSFMIAGLYRSGTTLLSRILNSHPQLCVASDPLRPLFNQYSSQIKYNLGLVSDLRLTPFDEGFSPIYQPYYEYLESAHFSEAIICDLHSLIYSLISQSLPYSPRFSSSISELSINPNDFNDWSSFLHFMFQSLCDTYSSTEITSYGFKEVWSIEAAIPLINSLGLGFKTISVVRDPLDIIASSKSNAGNYPLLYLARQFRKHLAITSYLLDKYPHNILVVDYQDLCHNPQKILYDITTFLGVDIFSLVDNLSPTDDNGLPFIKNSSYQHQIENFRFDQTSIGKYSKILTSSEIEWASYLTQMTLNSDFLSVDFLSSSVPQTAYPVRMPNSVAKWHTGFYGDYDSQVTRDVLELEHNRAQKVLVNKQYKCYSRESIVQLHNVIDQF